MKLFYRISILIIVLLIFGCVIGWNFFNKSVGPVSDDEKDISFVVPINSTYLSLAPSLKDAGLINSDFTYKIYIKLYSPSVLKAGTYNLNKTMGVKDIINVLSKGNNLNENVINITFREGLNMRQIADIIALNTGNKVIDVFDLLKDNSYLDEVIKNYWFINDDIKNSKIYYPLEGYLFPETYQFHKDATVKDIFKVMLDQMNKELSKYKEQINNSKYSVHQLLTLASIIELEASTSHERSGVAGVFYNRLNDKWTLGSDVTTYYAERKSFKEDLTRAELDSCNAYNTRSTCLVGLPVGPIANPGRESLFGVMNPSSHQYYYFVADKTGKTYFNVDSYGHSTTISNLKSAGLWYEYK